MIASKLKLGMLKTLTLMNDALQDVWDAAPESLKNADYCFYVGKGYTNPPEKFKNKIVTVVYIIDEFQIYYAPRILFCK